MGDPAPADGFDSYDALGWLMFVAFLIFAAWIVWWFYKKAQDVVGGAGRFNSVEEAVFEREAIRGVAIPPPDKPPADSSAPGTPMGTTKVPSPPGFAFGPPAAPLAGPLAETATGDLGRRLQALGVFDRIEGTVPLPVPPDGVIWRLKRGATALVLPRTESEATMAHFAQRFDYVLAPATRGEVLVVRRLENQVGDWMRG